MRDMIYYMLRVRCVCVASVYLGCVSAFSKKVQNGKYPPVS